MKRWRWVQPVTFGVHCGQNVRVSPNPSNSQVEALVLRVRQSLREAIVVVWDTGSPLRGLGPLQGDQEPLLSYTQDHSEKEAICRLGCCHQQTESADTLALDLEMGEISGFCLTHLKNFFRDFLKITYLIKTRKILYELISIYQILAASEIILIWEMRQRCPHASSQCNTVSFQTVK